MNIFVGNLSRETADADLRQSFEAFGQVTRATVITDKFTSESKGFGFVEMSSKAEADAALAGMNGTELHGRALNVSEARPRPERSDRRDSGSNGGGRQSW